MRVEGPKERPTTHARIVVCVRTLRVQKQHHIWHRLCMLCNSLHNNCSPSRQELAQWFAIYGPAALSIRTHNSQLDTPSGLQPS